MNNSRIKSIEEIAIRNEVSILHVMGIYMQYNKKLYFRKLKGEGLFNYNQGLFYSSEVEDQTFKLTERYLDIEKWRRLKGG
jgi:hypothetical protein